MSVSARKKRKKKKYEGFEFKIRANKHILLNSNIKKQTVIKQKDEYLNRQARHKLKKINTTTDQQTDRQINR